jgi:protein-tyrosine-phosphatase
MLQMKVIFACVHNAGRSQMAAAFFNSLAHTEDVQAESAGTQPGERVHHEVVEVMKEVGIDLKNAKPQLLTEQLAESAELLVTMGCGETCPYIPGLKRVDWPLEDPKGQPLEKVRQIRDEIKKRVESLISELDAN